MSPQLVAFDEKIRRVGLATRNALPVTGQRSVMMPGGIGPVSEATMAACARQDRILDAVANTNEIFFHLDARHVYFDSTHRRLYFVDGRHREISATVSKALEGMRVKAVFEQLHLDEHCLFSAARRVTLTAHQVAPVLIALRLAGINATIR